MRLSAIVAAALCVILLVAPRGGRTQTTITMQPTRAAPTGGNTPLSSTQVTTTIPAGLGYFRTGYQVQGSGYGCASWDTTAVTISANSATATCGGAGSFLIQAGSSETRTSVLPTNPLTAIEASGATLNVVWEVQ